MPDPDNIPIVRNFMRPPGLPPFDEVPIFGPVWNTGNAVIDFVEYGCYPTWTVWLETLWPALGDVVLQLLDFGPGDVIRGYFRPNSTRGYGGLIRGSRKKKPNKPSKTTGLARRVAVPEVGNEVGRKLPGSRMIRGRKVTGFETRIWQIDGVGQRLLWWWLVADVTNDFVVSWTTAIMESEACRRDNIGYVSAKKTSTQLGTNDTWHALLGWDEVTADPPSIWNNGQLVIPAGVKAYVTYQLEVVSGIPQKPNPFRIQVGATPGGSGPATPSVIDPDDVMSSPVLTGVIHGPQTVTFNYWGTDTALYHVGEAVMTASFQLE